MSVYRFLLPIILSVTLLACHQDDNAPEPINNNISLISPNNSLALGRQSAVFQHLSQVWQVSEIDGIPTDRLVILDFRDLANARAHMNIDDCGVFELALDIDNLDTGAFAVKEIERELDEHCSTTFEDTMMAIIASSQKLERSDSQKLTLTAYQNRLTLKPYP